ncbi:MAG: hypothetical protein K6G24_01640 [Lachnospiraceae bacterium]|nr:hypothetical protein [Lachnospiraceae bacterium]
MTDITDLRLEVADNEIMEPMKDFIEKFTKIYLLESFTQSDMHIPMKQHNRPEGTARCSVSNGITAE